MQILGRSIAKLTVVDYRLRSVADSIIDLYSLIAIVVNWKDIRSRFYAMATIY